MPDDGRSVFGAVLRGGYQERPTYGSGGRYGDPRGSTLSDLIGRSGELQARGHLEGSQSLSSGIREAGQQIGAYFRERDEKQEMAKRDAATVATIEGWDGQDPMALFAQLQKIRPQDAREYTNTILALRKGPQKDPEAELARFGKVAQFMADQPDDVIARGWPAIRQSLGSTAAQLGLGDAPEQWDPKLRPLIAKAGEVFGPPKKEKKFDIRRPGDVVVDPDTQEIVLKVPDKPAAGQTVKVPGPGGAPMEKTFTPEQMAQGVPVYQETRGPSVDPADRQMQWATDPTTGEERLMTNSEIRKLGGARPATADMRNKAEGRTFVARSIGAIKSLSEKVITKRGVAQRATAAGRTVESVLGNDPEFRTYQDSRKALAGNLAVAQQGSRPSDADIQSVWLPLVPDVFRDTDESAKMKWDLINTMSLPEKKGPQPSGGTLPQPKSRAEFDKLPSGAMYIDPNGVRRRKP